MTETQHILTLDKMKYGTSSIFENVVVYEKVCPQLLFRIINTAELILFDKKRYADGLAKLYKTERDLLVAYQYQYISSINKFVSQWYLQKHGWGRILPKDYLSMSVFHRPTRHTLCNQYLVDLDLINCHFEIVLSFLKQLELPHEYIKKYCDNVGQYREEIQEFYGVSKDVAKALFIRLIYGGSVAGWKTENNIVSLNDHPILIDILCELNVFMDLVWDNNQHIYTDILADNPNYYNKCNINKKKKSVMSFWCQSIERYIQEQTIRFLIDTHKLSICNFIPCQDGFMMRKKDYKPEYIAEINEFIKTTLNMVSRFTEKPFNEQYKVGVLSKNNVYKNFYLPELEDAQFARLLVDATFNYNQIITTGDSKSLEAYMYNGFYWERLPLHNAEFQKGRFDYLEDWCLSKVRLLEQVFNSQARLNSDVALSMAELGDLKTTKKELSKKIAQLRKANEPDEVDKLAKAERKLDHISLLMEVETVISKAKAKIHTLSRNCVRNSIIEVFLRSQHITEIKWDANPELFAFTNGIFDLTLQQFITPTKDQYIRTTCGWEYDFNYDTANVEFIRNLVNSILPIGPVRDYYLTYMSLGLSGNRVQRILINTGTGGNGKSLLRELLNKVLANYSVKIPNEIICSAIKAGGANPVVASMDGKRNIYFSEPESKQKLCTSTIKELTGDATIVGRQLYSEKTAVNLVATISGDCNALPPFDSVEPDAQHSLIRRLSIVPFITRAVSKAEYEEAEDKSLLNIKQNYAENPKWMLEYRQAYFHLLLEFYRIFKMNPAVLDDLPIECSSRAFSHLNASCNIMSWIDSELIKVDNNETSTPLPLKSLYERFKNADTFRTYSKSDQRTYTMKYFINLVTTSKDLRAFIKERNSYHNKVRLTTDCLIGYKFLADEDEEMDDSNV